MEFKNYKPSELGKTLFEEQINRSGFGSLYKRLKFEIPLAEPEQSQRMLSIVGLMEQTAGSLLRHIEHAAQNGRTLVRQDLLDGGYRMGDPNNFTKDARSILSWQEHFFGSKRFFLVNDKEAFEQFCRKQNERRRQGIGNRESEIIYIDKKELEGQENDSNGNPVIGIFGIGHTLDNGMRVVCLVSRTIRDDKAKYRTKDSPSYYDNQLSTLIFLPPNQAAQLPANVGLLTEF